MEQQVIKGQLHTGSSEGTLSLLLGDAALSEKEIAILCRRKKHGLERGLTSNEIMTYLYLKLHAYNGWYRYFQHADLTEHLGISDRDIYYVLSALQKARLISVHGDKYSHFKDIHIYHRGVKKKTRFLSLNRTYFREGEKDYEKFNSLSAGPKSMMLYILFREKLRPDAHGNSIEMNVGDISRYMGLKKSTVISYIKQVNEVWPDFLHIQKSCFGSAKEEILAAMADKRRRYGAICSKTIHKTSSTIENGAQGFWRNFDLWLKTHGIEERCNVARLLYDERTHGTDIERMKRNRELFFTILYAALKNGTGIYDIYKVFYRSVMRTGFFDEETVAALTVFYPVTE
jgi:hypothetical protein